jgi:hypothetical protein
MEHRYTLIYYLISSGMHVNPITSRSFTNMEQTIQISDMQKFSEKRPGVVRQSISVDGYISFICFEVMNLTPKFFAFCLYHTSTGIANGMEK